MSGSWLSAMVSVFFWARAGSAASVRANRRAESVVSARRMSMGTASIV